MDLLTQALDAFKRIAALASRRNQPGITQAQLLGVIETAAREQAAAIEYFQAMLKAETNDNAKQD